MVMTITTIIIQGWPSDTAFLGVDKPWMARGIDPTKDLPVALRVLFSDRPWMLLSATWGSPQFEDSGGGPRWLRITACQGPTWTGFSVQQDCNGRQPYLMWH